MIEGGQINEVVGASPKDFLKERIEGLQGA
jgi:hypothetical protein